jgi:DNA polymerase III subunit epsilon
MPSAVTRPVRTHSRTRAPARPAAPAGDTAGRTAGPAAGQTPGKATGETAAAHGYAIVDLEATGSSSHRHRVIELAVVLLDPDLRPQGDFATLVDPQGPVGPTHIHGITPEHLGGAPLFAGIARRLLGLLRGRVLVGHNVGADRAFLTAEYARLGLRLPPVPELCTMRMTAERRRAVPGPDGLSLRACAAAAGITPWSAHTALGDARATAALFAQLAAADPAEPDLAGCLALAAAVKWPEIAGVPARADALWIRRGRVAARRPVPNARPDGA